MPFRAISSGIGLFFTVTFHFKFLCLILYEAWDKFDDLNNHSFRKDLDLSVGTPASFVSSGLPKCVGLLSFQRVTNGLLEGEESFSCSCNVAAIPIDDCNTEVNSWTANYPRSQDDPKQGTAWDQMDELVNENKADYTRTYLTFVANIPTFLCAVVWIVYIFRHLCKVDAKYGTLKWYIQLSRLNNMSLLRRTVIFFFFIQVFVLVVCFIIAGSMRAASNCDAGGNDCLDDEEDKETYLERVAKLFNKEFIFEQFLCFFVLFDLYDVIDEENALLNLESSAVGNLKCYWIGYLPNGPNEIKELIEDSALHILLFNKYNLKGDQNKCSVDLKKLLGVDGANKFAQEVLMVAREAYKERPEDEEIDVVGLGGEGGGVDQGVELTAIGVGVNPNV
ncbi:hypothetical protein TrCOL_g13463 [Triparma columacea]|uniref:Uncharacterized protein n=1 Tax=Triparma columacea TaxID=722753 RepID=A0A9W7GJ95_9STRA|nr:hypothetical protein TrCOL_g13463 [Triparma columacea]